MQTHFTNPPEPGQIVQVRGLRLIGADVNRGSMPTGPLGEGLNHAQHLVSLTSIEDDAASETPMAASAPCTPGAPSPTANSCSSPAPA